MNLGDAIRFVTYPVLFSIGSILYAADAAKPDPDLPQPLDLSLVAPLIEKPPFTRPIDLSEKLQLTGIAYVEGKPVATLVDRETKQNYLISEKPNALGWKLAEAHASSQPRLSSVKLQVGTEIVTIRYHDSQIAPVPTGRIGPTVWPRDEEAIRNDENGRPYVRGSAYLSDADRERYYRGLSREGHEKFRQVIRDNREYMFKASPQERAAFARKVLDNVETEDRSRQQR